ncbi:MAG: aminoglycoside 3'-phosphotransferase/choline kinase family protein [Burkholderiaceae bacterium]
MLFPVASSSADAWDALLADDAALADGVAAIAQRHGLAGAHMRRYDSGSVPVYALGTAHALKLFPPDQASYFDVEARVLRFLGNALPVPTPEVTAAGTLEGWHYIVMTQLRGTRLVDAWPELPRHDRDRLADDLGHALAALHRLDVTPLDPIEPQWVPFVQAQIATAVERQRRRGLAPQWRAQIPAFLDAWQPTEPHTPALLHTEVMREHLIVEQRADGWRLSGLFDFEPAMLGDPMYEFASVGLFVACGDSRCLRRTLRAYGLADGELNPALACRFMAHALLHRYSNLPWYLQRLPPRGATTLEDLAQRWWALGA